MENLLFAFYTVLPIFLLVAFGFVIRKRGLLTVEYCDVTARLNFRFCLPALVFDSLYKSDIGTIFSGKLALLATAAAFALIAVGTLSGVLFLRDRKVRGSFIQGTFRGNLVLIALPMVLQALGPEAKAETAILAAIIVPLTNVVSVVVLAMCTNGKRGLDIPGILLGIVTNPMIVGVAAAMPFAIFGLGFPEPLAVFLKYVGGMAVPLALMDIGSGMVGRGRPTRAGAALGATAIKILAGPLFFGGFFFLGGMGPKSVAIMILLGTSPTAMSSHPMAKIMGCDVELAGDIVLVSTLGSAFTMAAAIVLIRSAGLA